MPIQFIGSVSGTNTATLPAHQAGDLIVAFAYRDGNNASTTSPSVDWIQIGATGTNTNGSRLEYRIATGSDTASGTWTTVTYPALTLNSNSGSSWVAAFAGNVVIQFRAKVSFSPGYAVVSLLTSGNSVIGSSNNIALSTTLTTYQAQIQATQPAHMVRIRVFE